MQNLVVTRFEHKYLLTQVQAAQLRQKLNAALPADVHNTGPTESYLVRSLYFDTPGSRDYLDKVEGLFTRQKLRLRVYGEGGDRAKLECKQKQGDYQKKPRCGSPVPSVTPSAREIFPRFWMRTTRIPIFCTRWPAGATVRPGWWNISGRPGIWACAIPG